MNDTTSGRPSGPNARSIDAAPELGREPLVPAVGGDRPADLDLVAAADLAAMRAAAGDQLAGVAVEERVPAEAVRLPVRRHLRDLAVDVGGSGDTA